MIGTRCKLLFAGFELLASGREGGFSLFYLGKLLIELLLGGIKFGTLGGNFGIELRESGRACLFDFLQSCLVLCVNFGR